MSIIRRALVLLTAVLLLAACQQDLAGRQLHIATGGQTGVYFELGTKLGQRWHEQLGLTVSVLPTDGSVGNIKELNDGNAEIGLVAADAADPTVNDTRDLRALGRVYDDYIQVIVRADSDITTLAGLRDKVVAIGSPDSGVAVVAKNLLHLAGLPPITDPMYRRPALSDSLNQLKNHQIDALFWSGGLPTPAITTAQASGTPLRMMNLDSTVEAVRKVFPYYEAATVPKTAYPNLVGTPVTTLVVHNLLMVGKNMPDDEAQALIREVFLEQQVLARDTDPADAAVADAAQLIDVRSAIETSPVQLHPGARDYYESVKP